MAIFDNNLKAEEEFGAFIPGSQEDDTFYLEKLDMYGGVLPDFDHEDTAISDLILEQLNPEAIAIRNERKAAKKNKFGSDYTPEVIEEAEETYQENASPQDFDNLKTLVNNELQEGNINEPPRWGDDYFNSSPEENNIEEDEELNFATSLVKDNRFDDLVDDDLKKLLKSELARSEERKLSKPPADDFENEINEKSNRLREFGGAYVSPFGEVPSFEDHPEIMDFEAIHAESPSTYGLKELSEIEEAKKEEVENNQKVKKGKKKRKPMPLWQIISLSAAAVLIIGTLVTLGVLKFFTDPNFMRFGKSKKDSTQISHNEKPKSKKNKDVKVVESKATVKDTSKEKPKEIAENSKVNEKQIETPTKEAPIKEEPKKVESKTIKIAEPEKKIVTKEPKLNKKDIVINDVKPHNKENKIIKEPKETKVQKEKIEKIVEKKTQNKKESKTYVPTSNDDEDNVKPSFAVQIYATPSKEDAEDWVNKLKQKSAKNVRIDSQMIRDVKWFRVRFGDFENKEEAKLAALKLGFAQSWIDRVR